MGLSRKGRPLEQLTIMPPHLRAGHAFHDLAGYVAGINRARLATSSRRTGLGGDLPCRLVGKVEAPDEASTMQRRSKNTELPNHGNRCDSWHIRFCKTDLTH
jgi:hypothetical protein